MDSPTPPPARLPPPPLPDEPPPLLRVRTPAHFSGPASGPVSFVRFLLAAPGPLLFAACLLGVPVLAAILWWLPVRPSHVDYTAYATRSAGGVEPDAPASAEMARLLVDSEPQLATVRIGADSVGVTPLYLDRVPAGAVFVAVQTAEGARDTLVTLRPGEDANVLLRIRQAPRRAAESAPPREVAQARPEEPDPPRTASSDVRREASSRDASPAVTVEARPAAPERPSRPARSSRPAPNTPPPARSVEPARSRGAAASLRIASDPPGATASVDGREVGQTPVTVVALAPGTYTVEVTSAGQTRQTQVTMSGQPRSVQLRLPPRTGTLEVSAPAGSEVFVDGRSRGVTGAEPLSLALAPGPHRVRVVSPEGAVTTETAIVSASVTVSLTVRAREPAALSPD